MTGVSAPVLDRYQNVIAAISVITPSEQSEPTAHTPAGAAVARAMATASIGSPLPWVSRPGH